MDQNKISGDLLGGNKEKFIETKNLRIAGHLLQWEDVVIQISNVSMITTASVQPPIFPIWALIMGCAGLACMAFAWPLGLLLLALTVLVFYLWHKEVEKKKKLKALSIHLSSGRIFSILFPNIEFLNTVLRVFANIFEEGGQTANTTYQIDIQNCKIDNQSSFIAEQKV